MKGKRVSLLSYIAKDIENHMLYVNASISTFVRATWSTPSSICGRNTAAGAGTGPLSPFTFLIHCSPGIHRNALACQLLDLIQLESTHLVTCSARSFTGRTDVAGNYASNALFQFGQAAPRPPLSHHPGHLPLQHAIVIVVI